MIRSFLSTTGMASRAYGRRVAQRDRLRAARVEGQRLRRAQGRGRARRRLGGSGMNERRGGIRPPVPGARACGAGVPGPGLDRGPRRAREGRRHVQSPARRVPRGVRHVGRGGHVRRTSP